MSIKPRRNRLNVRRRVLKSFLGHTKPGSMVILARRTQQTSRRTNSVSTPDAAALQPDVTRQEGNWYQQDAYACTRLHSYPFLKKRAHFLKGFSVCFVQRVRKVNKGFGSIVFKSTNIAFVSLQILKALRSSVNFHCQCVLT